jgi:F-type H+-transporting ATPase subunit a
VAAEPINFFQLIAHTAGRLPPVLVGTWIVMAFLLIFGYAARRSLVTASDPTIPDEGLTLRHLAEVAVEWIDGLVMQVSELHEARRYIPFFGSLFLFILTANFMGLIPGLTPPTSDTDLTFALGGICFVYYLYQGFAHQGPKYLLSSSVRCGGSAGSWW